MPTRPGDVYRFVITQRQLNERAGAALVDALTARVTGGRCETAVTRRVPAQPSGVPAGKVYMGVDVGFVDWTGEKPRPGDMAVVIGCRANRVATSGQGVSGFRAPTFAEARCECKCPGATGTAFIAVNDVSVYRISHVVGLEVPAGTPTAFLGHVETVDIVGLAVDASEPNTLYVLDDRRGLTNKVTNASPSQTILANSYYTVVEYTLSGGAYAFSQVYPLTHPGLPGSIVFTVDPVEDLIRNQVDPPSIYPGNPLSVIDGQLHITMNRAPARYQRLEGGTLVTHTLTLDGADYDRGLRGRIVQVRDKPARRTNRYCISWMGDDDFDNAKPGAAFEVLQFNENDEITARVTDATLLSPFQLAAVCNRLLVLNSDRYGRTPNDPNGTLLPRTTGEEV